MSNKIQYLLSGHIFWKLEDGTKRVRSGEFSNLILNQGLDFVADRSFANCFRACALGSGASIPVRANVGLDNEIQRASFDTSSVDSNGSTIDGNVLKLFRSFRFTVNSDFSLKEVGFSPFSEAGNNLFSRALMIGSEGVPAELSVTSGSALTIKYELSISVNNTSFATNNGLISAQIMGLKGINSSGEEFNMDAANGANEPSCSTTIFLSKDSSAAGAFNSCVTRSNGAVSPAYNSTYIIGQFSRKKVGLFNPKDALQWASAGVGSLGAHGLVFVRDTPNLVNSHVLISFEYIWGEQEYASNRFFAWIDSEDMIRGLHKQTGPIAYFSL